MDPIPVGGEEFRVTYDQKGLGTGYTTAILIVNDCRVFSRRHITKYRAILKIAAVYGIFIIAVGVVHYYFYNIIIGKIIPYKDIVHIPTWISKISNQYIIPSYDRTGTIHYLNKITSWIRTIYRTGTPNR